MIDIPLRSFFSELSNFFSVIYLINNKKISLFINLLLAPFIIDHIIRYSLNFNSMIQITKNQIYYLPLNLIDYYIILNKNNNYYYAIVSGFISYFFMYKYHKFNKYLLNYKKDILILILLFIMLYNGYKNNIKSLIFFCIRDIVYHLLELIFVSIN